MLERISGGDERILVGIDVVLAPELDEVAGRCIGQGVRALFILLVVASSSRQVEGRWSLANERISRDVLLNVPLVAPQRADRDVGIDPAAVGQNNVEHLALA